jgi:hypothetical protein
MQKSLQRALLLAGAIATLTTSWSFGDTGGLGEAHFANSCKPAGQARFEEGVLLLHSFEFKEAERSFKAVEVKSGVFREVNRFVEIGLSRAHREPRSIIEKHACPLPLALLQKQGIYSPVEVTGDSICPNRELTYPRELWIFWS